MRFVDIFGDESDEKRIVRSLSEDVELMLTKIPVQMADSDGFGEADGEEHFIVFGLQSRAQIRKLRRETGPGSTSGLSSSRWRADVTGCVVCSLPQAKSC